MGRRKTTSRRSENGGAVQPATESPHSSDYIPGEESRQPGNGDLPVEDYAADEEDDCQIDEYDVTAAPNDFNITTIYSFIESGAVVIPGFQRNFVWDIKRASKLIESLILGLPVPQLFLYEEERNKFLVIDGQQRLMSIYYFIKQRFPRKEKRAALRRIIEKHRRVPDEILQDDDYFSKFNLDLKENLPRHRNVFRGLNYATLGQYKTQFDLRPVRNVIVKQNSPQDDHSAIYEIFNRLNSGGVNLTPQEVRISLYHSKFYDMLYRANLHEAWRRLLNAPEPSLHAKDVEILLRGFAMLIASEEYAPSMTKFLNGFSRRVQAYDDAQNGYCERLLESFLTACRGLEDDAFLNKRNRRFNIALFEAVFAGGCGRYYKEKSLVEGTLDETRLKALESDPQFVQATLRGTTQSANVKMRLARAGELIGPI